MRDSQATQYIAFFPSCETRETRETRTDIFARIESHFPQNSREKNCKTRLAVNPTWRYPNILAPLAGRRPYTVYLDAMSAGGLPAGLLCKYGEQLRLQLWTVEGLLEGVLG